ncbi:MAG: hypothetical protein ACK4F9_00925 [Brevinematia bacterium]
MLIGIISTLKYEILLIKKLINTNYSYYGIFIFVSFLKHLADYIMSKKLGTPVSVFKFLDILKDEKIISSEEEDFIINCISITRNKNKLIETHVKISKEKIIKIIDKIQKTLLFIDH